MLPFSFLRAHGRLIAFGAVMVLCSAVGQTYFVSLFADQFRADFGLTHGEFGSVFSAGTVAGAAVLIWAGRGIDRVPLPVVAGTVLAALAGLCLFVGLAWDAVALGLGFFGLRLFGQGLAVHTALTTMARAFSAQRGRAISLASLGHTVGNMALPALVVLALDGLSWRQVWFVAAGVLLAILPLTLWLLRGQRITGRDAHPGTGATPAGTSDAAPASYRLGDALRDPGLWLRLPALLAPAFIFTGLVIHQQHIAAAKGWSDALMAGGFSTFAITSAASLLLAGPVVDRLTAQRLVPVYLVWLGGGCLVLALGDAPIFVPLFFGLMGAGTGFAVVLNAAVWAELYGTVHLGAIRAFGQAAMGFASGLAPALIGLLLDIGVPVVALSAGAAAYCVLASALAALAGAPRAAACSA